MCSRQRKLRGAVVEGRRLPGGRRMTRLAVLAEIPCNVIRVGRAGKIRSVALITVGIDEGVIVVRVARLALQRRVLPGKGKLGCAMVERRPAPRRRRMTQDAVGRETQRLMVRVGRRCKIRVVTLITGRIREPIIVVDVAGLTLHRLMETGQCEFRSAMVEGRRLPGGCRMAHRAVVRESSRLVIRVGGRGEIRLMTIGAIGGESCITVVRMTLVTGDRGVGSRQGELCVGVRKGRRMPDLRGMARPAIRGESTCNVVGVCRRCELCRMTGIAIRRSRFEFVPLVAR